MSINTIGSGAGSTTHSRGVGMRRAGVSVGGLVVLLVVLPFLVPNAYWTVIATQVLIFWILVTGLNLVVGYAGQLAVGHVGLLAVGAYTACSVAQNFGFNAFAALVASAVLGAIAGLLVGLPALRLRRFYFAMLTLGFATIVSQLAVVWRGVTGGGTGTEAPAFPAPFDIPGGFYWLCLLFAIVATYLTWQYGRSNSGRALIAIRDADVAAESLGVRVLRLKLVTFTFSGLLAGVSGALYASVQTYVTPEAFNFDLSMLFFTCVLLGGQGRVFAPFVATVVLVVLPDLVTPLAQYSAVFYAVLMLLVVLLLPNGVGGLVDRLRDRFRKDEPTERIDEPAGVAGLWRGAASVRPAETLSITAGVKEFGGVRALDGVELELRAGTVHGLIGPNGSGKTTVLNALSGFYSLNSGTIRLDGAEITGWSTQERARAGIARCFQTPRLPGALTAFENVMLGGYTSAETTSIESFTGLGRARRREAKLRDAAHEALHAVGLSHIADIKTERVQHSQQRFLEIARCLVEQPKFLLLDEPAAGLAEDEIAKLSSLIGSIAAAGTGVLLVEHHTDLVFDACGEVTVLNFGKVLVHDTPEAVRANDTVVHAYLGADMQSPTPLLEVKDLCAGYGKLKILHDVSLTVREGEVVALLGANGAVKTTLLGAMSGLVPDISAGTVRFDGKDITGARPRAVVRAGLLQVIEGHRVFANITVEENLHLGGFGLNKSHRATRLEQAYTIFPELAERRKLKAGQLSGGQQQMLVIAQGLIRNPKLLMLDEPSAGLSPVLVDRILTVMTSLSGEGLAVIIVEQLVDKVLAASDRAYVLTQGAITYTGSARDLASDDKLKQAYLG